MEMLFLFCAIFGGTVLVAQFLLGFGGDHGHGTDGPDDAMDHMGDLHGGDDASHADHGEQGERHGSTWMFGVLSFRTVMIGVTFFGLTGRASLASEFEQPWPFVIAIGCGLGSMYGVYYLMRGLFKLTAEGTQRIDRSVGEEGMVYLTIPAHNSGVGKVHVSFQNRLVEYEAMTAGEKLPTGTRVVVVGVLASDRVEVEPATEPVRQTNV